MRRGDAEFQCAAWTAAVFCNSATASDSTGSAGHSLSKLLTRRNHRVDKPLAKEILLAVGVPVPEGRGSPTPKTPGRQRGNTAASGGEARGG